jgi:putative heme-binding domain-containing protein
MIRLQSAVASAIAWALFAGCVAVAAQAGSVQPAQGAPTPAGPQLTPEEILDHHTKDEKGGSAEAGRPLYEKLCAGCHRFGAIGKDVGPDLSTITSRFKKRDILDSILWPSKVISDQYQAEMIELTNGSVVTGVLVRESAAAVLIRTGENPDKPVAVPKGQIANRAPSTVSLMPAGLLNGLSHTEIANLLAFVMAPAPAK